MKMNELKERKRKFEKDCLRLIKEYEKDTREKVSVIHVNRQEKIRMDGEVFCSDLGVTIYSR